MQADVLVVGGGPAGLATAIAASLKNLRVTLVDFRKPLIDKPCGEGLMPEAVAALRTLGINLDSTLGFPFSGFRFADEKSSASAHISQGTAFGLRRTVLHRLLIERATQLGVYFLWGGKISNLDSQGACIDGISISAKWIVGADGGHSTVRQFAGLGAPGYRQSRFGFRRHYAIAPWSELVEVYWGRKLQMVVTPVSSSEVCISLFTGDSRARMSPGFDQFPAVARRLRGARPVSAEAGAVTSFGLARGVVRENVALVGDAGCSVDAIAGQGLSLAFQQSLALADALGRQNLALYESAHRCITRSAVRMTQLLLWLNASTLLRRKVLRLFDARPELFAKLISIHTGGSAPDALNAVGIMDLGWRALWA